MPITVRDQGTGGNRVAINEADLQAGAGLIEFQGSDAEVSVESGHFVGAHIMVGSNARVHIGAGCILGSVTIYAGSGAEIRIGAGTGFSGTSSLMAHEPAKIIIGEGCLFASETAVMSSDMHSVIKCISGRRINPAADVEIGARVWIGFRAIILKGVRIGEGAVIGAGAVVSGEVEGFCAAAGNPARVVRSGVTWNRDLLPMD